MPDLKKYWQEIRAIEKSLPTEVWLVSLQNLAKGQVGGAIVEVAAAAAAKLLHAKSQRLATDEEIEAHKARQAETQRQVFEQRMRKQGIAVIPVVRR
jgi:2,4-dienoyl-CoA reductase-like NADH-dependent reductase (Old Yellow Enzyme family)